MSKAAKQIGTVVVLALSPFVLPRAEAQDQTPTSEAGRISDTLHSAAYPEVIYPDGIIPDWDRGYVIHYEFEVNYSPDAPMVVMYDATGKRVREGRIWPQGAGSVRIRRTAATGDGAILAAGWAVMQDGSIQHYIAKTDLAGKTVQSLQTESLPPSRFAKRRTALFGALGRPRILMMASSMTPMFLGTTALKMGSSTAFCRKTLWKRRSARRSRGSRRSAAMCDVGKTKFRCT